MKETSLFVHRFLQQIGKVGSIIPSSRFLVKKVMEMVPFDQVKVLVELGAGTGVLTLAILKQKKKETDFVILEPDEEFFAFLKEKFSNEKRTKVIRENAEHLQSVLKNWKLPLSDCIISSLPFASLGNKTTEKILLEIKRSLSPAGSFVFYQYTPIRLPLILKYFKVNRFNFTPLNAPPAFVFSCSLRD